MQEKIEKFAIAVIAVVVGLWVYSVVVSATKASTP
jgi:hypothetical protein